LAAILVATNTKTNPRGKQGGRPGRRNKSNAYKIDL